MTLLEIAKFYDGNVRVAMEVTQAVLPGMRASGWGRIVNVSSLVTWGTAGRTAYGTAKAALDAGTRVWAGETRSQTLRVDGGGSIAAA